MDKSQDLKIRFDRPASTSMEPSALSPSSVPSQDQIRNLLLVMNDREQKLSELATQQQRLILWRVQFVRLEREWHEVLVHLSSSHISLRCIQQIKIMINNFEAKLASNLTLAISLTDAEKFHRDHEDIKPFVDVSTHLVSAEHSCQSLLVWLEARIGTATSLFPDERLDRRKIIDPG